MKRIHLLAIFASIALAACGGKSKNDTTPPGGGESTSGTGDTATPSAGPAAETPTPDTAPEPDPHERLLAAELKAYQSAKPVLEQRCGGCHIQGGPKATPKKLEHIDMTSYPFTGHHTATITATVRHVLGIDGAKPTMPKDKPGSVKGDELALIAAWADAYDAAEKGGAHGEHASAGHDHHDH